MNTYFYPTSRRSSALNPDLISHHRASAHFGHSSKKEALHQQLLEGIFDALPSQASTLDRQALLQAIRHNKALPLPKGTCVQYGVIQPDGQVDSPYPELRLLAQTAWKESDTRLKTPQPLVMTVQTSETSALLDSYIKNSLKKTFAHEYTDPETRIKHRNVILSDLIEKLIAGQATRGTIPTEVLSGLRGNSSHPSLLEPLYRLNVPGNAPLTQALNQPEATWPVRQKLLGLDLARKIYAENQEVEWESIALSLLLGIAGEPTINRIFPGGGPTASTVRTTLMSGVDILGNILSVAGVAKENLKERGQSLSLKSIYGEKRTLSDIVKNPWDMQGEAGPLIQQGIKAGGLGGLLGILFNVPAGAILSMPNAGVDARAVVGGIGAAGSAVAIPTVIRDTKASYTHSIEALIREGKIRLPNHVSIDSPQGRQLIERMALKEMNARIGIASSIKATNPIILAGAGTVILAGEKLCIPREYVQTAYMALAPVMHNFLRLVLTGVEKFWTIPHRIKHLQKLAYDSGSASLSPAQVHAMDKALLSDIDTKLGQGIASITSAFFVGSVLLSAEVLYFLQAVRKEKTQKITQNMTPAFTLPPNFQPAAYMSSPASYTSMSFLP